MIGWCFEKPGLSYWNIEQTKTGYRSAAQTNRRDSTWVTFSWYLKINIKDKNGVERTGASIILYKGTGTYLGSDYKELAFLGYSPITYPAYFFVDKDEHAKLVECLDVSGYTDWNANSFNRQGGDLPNFYFSECGIY